MLHRRKKIRNKSKKSVRNTFLLLWMFTIALLILSLLISKAFGRFLSLRRQLVPLPVPLVRIIESPDPLVLARESSSVLGFGTFDPFDVITAVNEERTKSGRKPLRANETLMRAAALRADAILKNENFSHQDPFTKIELGTVLPKLNYHFVYASENIGMGGNSGKDFVDGFMHSTSHRINLLDPSLSDTGVAVVDGPFDRYYVNIVVQIFTIPGGLDEYLGYNQSDKQFYETQFASVNTKLEPITWFLLRLGNAHQYTSDKRILFTQQKDILQTIITVMRKSEPLETHHVALIRQYNKTLQSL